MLRKALVNMITLVVIISGFLLLIPKAQAQGNLIIMPRRVVFEGSKRTQVLNVANTGTDTAKYLISVVQYRMLENGNFESVTLPDSGQNFADKNFRFFPRSVILAPNESQTIKVQVIGATQLTAGEYRSHLYFRAVPNEKPLEKKDTAAFAKLMTIHLVPTFGIAIPVIIRIGSSLTEVKLSRPVIGVNSDGSPQLELSFSRSGAISVYGDVKVNHISLEGKITQVGLAKGFAIYTPNSIRHFLLNLDAKSGIDYHKGKLRVVFSTPPEAKSIVLASSELDLI